MSISIHGKDYAEILKFKIFQSIYRFPNKSQEIFISIARSDYCMTENMTVFTACYAVSV